MSNSLLDLPDDIPRPIDDGACRNLEGHSFPKIQLRATNNKLVSFESKKSILVLYIYPMTGRPNVPLPNDWNSIPGARGCTPQSCSFRDNYNELLGFEAIVFGLSAQTTEYQNEAKERLHLPFELLSDTELILKKTLSIPTFNVDGDEFYKRVTLIVKDGKIVKVFYPIFPPDLNAKQVIEWLKLNT